jgi:hypothetical protein
MRGLLDIKTAEGHDYSMARQLEQELARHRSMLAH